MKHKEYAAIFAALALLAFAFGDSRPAAAADGGTAAAPAASQPFQKPLKGRAKRIQMLETQLGLTDDQTAQVRSILTTEEDKARSVKTNADLSPDEKRTQIEALRKESRQQIAAILTPDQRRKLRQVQRDRLGAAPGARKARRAAASETPGAQPATAPANP